MLMERAQELAAVTELVESATHGRGGVLWIEGTAGIGKTSLLDRARSHAVGARVLSARAGVLERDLAFGVVRGLFEPLLAHPDDVAELLGGAARLAAPVITPNPGPDTAQGSAATLHGIYWLTANLADRGPVLLVVDDAHWADPPSLSALAYLARRIADLPVALLVAARPTGPETDPDLVAAIRERSDVVLRPRPLSRCGTGALVDEILCDAAGEPATAEFGTACHDATGGNPLLLRALLGVLVADGVRPDDRGVDAVVRRAPEVVGTAVAQRLRHAGPDVTAVARAVAVLGGGAALRHVAALTGMEPDRVADLTVPLVEMGLLRDGRPLTFGHPLVEQAVLASTTPGERHRGHRTAARVLAGEDAEPELVAAHLLQTEALGDPDTVSALRGAARSALAKGAPGSATTYLRRAREEPPLQPVRADVLFELGAATVRVSYGDGVALLEEALDAATDPGRRARIALELARSLRVTLDYRRALAVLDRALHGLAEVDAELALELEAEVVGLSRGNPERRAVALERSRALHDAARPPTRGRALLLASTAVDALQDGDEERAVATAVDALAVALAHDPPDPGVLLPATTVLLSTDRLDEMVETCETMISDARRRGSIADFASASVLRAQSRYLQGHLADAEADARTADELAAEHRVPRARRYTQAWLVTVLVERGQVVEADRALADSGVTADLAYLLDARGRLHLARDRAAEALDDFTECGRRLERRGVRHPGLLSWQASAALALHRLGRTDEAARAASGAIAAARSWSAPRALGTALRSAGLVTGDEAALREAVAVLAVTPARLELARARVDLGALLRRDNRRGEARDELSRGRELAARCGADALTERARGELMAAGARPRTVALSGPDALTTSERRVAELAADGLSNRTVAQALFVTTKTVETHLGSVYRKLGVTGRAALSGVLG